MRAKIKTKKLSKPVVKVAVPKERNKPRKSQGCCGRGRIKSE